MLRIGLIFIAVALSACGDGPDWLGADDETATPRPGGEGGAGGSGPLPIDREPNPWTPDSPDPEPGTPVPAPDEGLTLLTRWSDGVDVDVDQLVWAGPGEIRFRLGLKESESGKPAPAISAERQSCTHAHRCCGSPGHQLPPVMLAVVATDSNLAPF